MGRGEEGASGLVFNRIPKSNASGSHIAHPGADSHQIVIPGRLAVPDCELPDGEQHSPILEVLVARSGAPDVFRPGPFQPHEVACLA